MYVLVDTTDSFKRHIFACKFNFRNFGRNHHTCTLLRLSSFISRCNNILKLNMPITIFKCSYKPIFSHVHYKPRFKQCRSQFKGPLSRKSAQLFFCHRAIGSALTQALHSNTGTLQQAPRGTFPIGEVPDRHYDVTLHTSRASVVPYAKTWLHTDSDMLPWTQIVPVKRRRRADCISAGRVSYSVTLTQWLFHLNTISWNTILFSAWERSYDFSLNIVGVAHEYLEMHVRSVVGAWEDVMKQFSVEPWLLAFIADNQASEPLPPAKQGMLIKSSVRN